MKTALLVAACAVALGAAVANWRGLSREIASAGSRAVAVPRASTSTPADSGLGGAAKAKRTATEYFGLGRVGDSLPDLELVSLSGEKVSLASLRGRPMLLNLWATWCAPCLREMPELAAIHQQYAGRGLVVVGVNVEDAQRVKVQAFVSERKLPFAVWLDPEMHTANALRVLGLPATFVIDRRGRIVLRRSGAITADDSELQHALEIAGAAPRSTRPRS